jgi:hypothetical protein
MLDNIRWKRRFQPQSTALYPMVSVFVEICSLLVYQEAWSGNHIPTFRDMGSIRCPETSVKDHHSMLCNIPEERRFDQHRGGGLKSQEDFFVRLFVRSVAPFTFASCSHASSSRCGSTPAARIPSSPNSHPV